MITAVWIRLSRFKALNSPISGWSLTMYQQLSEDDFQKLADMAKKEFGLSLPLNKMYLIQNRLSKRLQQHSCEDYRSYIQVLESNQSELVHFINSLTTNKTEFFREIDHFSFLSDVALPEWQRKHPTRKLIYVWCAAASTGEEPLTLAMVLARFAKSRNLDFRILATDIDTTVLDFASKGIYPEHRIHDMPEDYLKEFFLKGRGSHQGSFRADPELLQHIKYRRFNLIRDNLATHFNFDFIFLRNVLIYFDRPTVHQVVDRLLSHLEQTGYFFVGHSESLHTMSHKIQSVAPAVYRQRLL
ncbi:MAG: CheR family methyltransferase [Oligoflexus sp.]